MSEYWAPEKPLYSSCRYIFIACFCIFPNLEVSPPRAGRTWSGRHESAQRRGSAGRQPLTPWSLAFLRVTLWWNFWTFEWCRSGPGVVLAVEHHWTLSWEEGRKLGLNAFSCLPTVAELTQGWNGLGFPPKGLCWWEAMRRISRPFQASVVRGGGAVTAWRITDGCEKHGLWDWVLPLDYTVLCNSDSFGLAMQSNDGVVCLKFWFKSTEIHIHFL